MRPSSKHRVYFVFCLVSVLLLFYLKTSRLTVRTFELYEVQEMMANTSKTNNTSRFPVAPDMVEGFNRGMNITIPMWAELNRKFDHVMLGGRSIPYNSSNKVVIIVPYRDRRIHLKLFLAHMHTFLRRQRLEYVIYVVEMGSDVLFNRASLSNAGYLEVMRREKTPCVIFHDVDMLPTIDANHYFCNDTVRHYAHAVEQYGYKLLYKEYVGGVIAFPAKLFTQINGYSNFFQGWGGEDDDLYMRIIHSKIPWTRQSAELGRYKSWSHHKQPRLVNREKYYKTSAKRMAYDGLNTVKYVVVAYEKRPLFTWMLLKLIPVRDKLTNIKPKFVLTD